MLELVRNDWVRETLDAQNAKMFDTDASPESFSKIMIASSSLWLLLGLLLGEKRTQGMEEKNYNSTFASKKLIDTTKNFKDDDDSSPKCSDFGSDKVPQREFSKHRSRCRHRNVKIGRESKLGNV